MTISYTAHQEITFDQSLEHTSFYHLLPFGQKELTALDNFNKEDPFYLLPQFEADGYLYMGIREASSNEKLTLFFQLSNDQVTNFSKHHIPSIQWNYLSDGHWIDLPQRNIIKDTTHQFTESGIIELVLPEYSIEHQEKLDPKLFWLRIEVYGNTEMLCSALMVDTQAVLVKRVFDAEDHPDFPLSPNSINQLVEKKASIKKIRQPFASFGGRKKESINNYLTRVSERLRHKGRAVTKWDYERIILEAFPEVYQAKLVKEVADSYNNVDALNPLHLIVIPHNHPYNHSICPKFNYRILEHIEAYLLKIQSPSLRRIQVRNPQYGYIKVILKFKFQEDKDIGSRMDQLELAIDHFISPWLKNKELPVQLGGQVSNCLLYTSPSPRDQRGSRMPSSA